MDRSVVLRKAKAKAKTDFTNIRRRLHLESLTSEERSTTWQELEVAQAEVSNIIQELLEYYEEFQDQKAVEKLLEELEKVESQHEKALECITKHQDWQEPTNSEQSAKDITVKQESDKFVEDSASEIRTEPAEHEVSTRHVEKSAAAEAPVAPPRTESASAFSSPARVAQAFQSRDNNGGDVANSRPRVGFTYTPNEYVDVADFREQRMSRQWSRSGIDYPSSPASFSSTSVSEVPAPADIYKRLKPVAIPVFKGEKRQFESWKAAFFTCIDAAAISPQLKMLQLLQYLEGEPLRCVQTLGYSEAAYEAAKSRLERKYGGSRRQLAVHLEEIEQFSPIKYGQYRELEKFCELLDVAIVALKDAGSEAELGAGTFYFKLQRKLNERLLTSYQRWLRDSDEEESVKTLYKFIAQEAEDQIIANETISGVASMTVQPKPRQASGKSFMASSSQQSSSKQCAICRKTHVISACEQFQSYSVGKRWDEAKKAGLCYRCLGRGHRGNDCSKNKTCGEDGCTQNHHPLLHGSRKAPPPPASAEKEPTDGSRRKSFMVQSTTVVAAPSAIEGEQSATAPTIPPPSVSFTAERADAEPPLTLRTVPVILSNEGRHIRVNAMLDDGSTSSYINTEIAEYLGLQAEKREITIQTVNGKCNTFLSMPVQVTMESLDGKTTTTLDCETLPDVTGDMQPVNWQQARHQWEHLRYIEFPKVNVDSRVDVLIGINHSELHYSLEDVMGKPGEPIARLTPLGWTCVGPPARRSSVRTYATYHINRTSEQPEDAQLSKLVQQLWEVEQGAAAEHTPEDAEVLRRTTEATTKLDARYQVRVPWRDDQHEMPDNYGMAKKRLMNTENRLKRDANVAAAYQQTIDKYLEKGYIRKVKPEESQPSSVWYMPHFAIVRPDKATTKTRIVFDASAKSEGVSLNDMQHAGPKLQRNLVDVLLRFRKNPVALVCDIAEMYLQVELHQEDRPYHRFLWRNMNTDREPDVYEFQRVVFGAASSPFLAQFVAQENGRMNADAYPRAAEAVVDSTYMDDTMDSVRTALQGIELYEDLTKVWSEAGMQPRKWLSNDPTVLAAIPPELRANEVDLEAGQLPVTKTLGVMWRATEDTFGFRFAAADEPTTKRGFLKRLATVFDPLGLIGPVVISGRKILQDMWTAGVEWDDQLPEETSKTAVEWIRQLQNAAELSVPRCLSEQAPVASVRLHVFGDASQSAYGAAVYAVTEYTDGHRSARLAASKSRVAPLDATSIPRLELMAAVVATELAQSASKALSMDLADVTLWTDSQNVLWWIRNRSRSFKPFVSHRVSEIQRATQPSQWRYVPTHDNPADILSRGSNTAELAEQSLWWAGPNFLVKGEEEWPATVQVKIPSQPEVRASANLTTMATTTVQPADSTPWPLDPERFSDFDRLVRKTAWVLRFLTNATSPPEDRQTGNLTPEELVDSELRIIRLTQQTAFEEYRLVKNGNSLPEASKLSALHPFVDEDGVMRVGGRLQKSDLAYDAQHPLILPRKNRVTTLIIKNAHEKGHHVCGTSHTLAILQLKYWIIAGRQAVREWEAECAKCKLLKAKPATQLMAPLPKSRTTEPLKAFAKCSVDFAGPFTTIQGRGQRRAKRYLCLFTCMATRAVHLELAYSLSTDGFLNAFARMVSRRGAPDLVMSDNGTNFVGAERELREMLQELDRQKITTKHPRMTWLFNPPLAPHFGGVHESMVKSAKRALAAILKNAEVNDEELQTAIVAAEDLVNSRPLVYPSTHANDELPLTPNHFLIGTAGTQFAPGCDATPFTPTRRWRYVQDLVRQFWRRWMTEYLPTLNRRSKWQRNQPEIAVGDVVLVVDPSVGRRDWQLGRVTKAFPGSDGHTRVVTVQVGQKTLTRPVTRLCRIASE